MSAAGKNAAPCPHSRPALRDGLIFFEFWETKARYAFNFTPLLLLLALAALLNLARGHSTHP